MPRPNVDYAQRNTKTRAAFNAYCEAHPQERFWQALRNWSGFDFIYASQEIVRVDEAPIDTFNWEGRNG